jgi:hypothetical protein
MPREIWQEVDSAYVIFHGLLDHLADSDYPDDGRDYTAATYCRGKIVDLLLETPVRCYRCLALTGASAAPPRRWC